MRRIPARLYRLGINLWPPFAGAGIRVRYIAADWREVVVELVDGRAHRRIDGTASGASLYAMTDPFFALMVARNLPAGYAVWDRAASVDFLAPGRGRARAQLRLEQADLDAIVNATAGGDRHLHLFHADVTDAEGLVVARVDKLVYVRRGREPG